MQPVEHSTPLILALTIFTLCYFLFRLRQAYAGKQFYIRKLPGLDLVDEAISRSAELGRPSVFSTGLTGVGPVLYAVLSLLRYVSKQVARAKVKLLIPQNTPEVLAMVETTAEDAYQEVGKGSAWDPTSIVFLSEEQLAFASGYMGLVHRENAGSAFLFGTFAGESLILAEAGQQVGAMQVSGSVSPEQVAFFVCTCDYTLIGEELFAASAYLDKEPVQVASVLTQDMFKFFCVLLIVAGVTLSTIASVTGSPKSTVLAGAFSFSWNSLFFGVE